MSDLDQTQNLWMRALADAQFSPEETLLVLVEAAPEIGTPEVTYLGPGADVSTSPLALTAEESSQLAAESEKHRVALSPAHSPEVQLGLMRWALERARQAQANPFYWAFGEAINSAIHPLYGNTGLGSAVVYHTIPVMRDADSAAGYLVTGVFGPQVGELWGPRGSLFRTDQPRPELETLARRLVAFAAIHSDEMQQWLNNQGITLAAFLTEVHPDAPQWWAGLTQNEDLRHLGKSAKYYIPTAEQIEAAGANPAQAWRPLQRHLDIALARGLDVLPPPPVSGSSFWS